MTTSIEWTRNSDGSQGETWNPIRARRRSDRRPGWYCQKVSPGCLNCYAETMNQFRGTQTPYTFPALDEVEVYLDQKALLKPLHWRDPRNVFVCSMTDLFAEFVPDEWIDQIYAVEAMTQRHTYMHLTKRPERRLWWHTSQETPARMPAADAVSGILHDQYGWSDTQCYDLEWPLRNVREGTSICIQKEAEDLIPITLLTPAALHWLSMEPLLEPVEISGWLSPAFHVSASGPIDERTGAALVHLARAAYKHEGGALIDWVVVGGESGPDARPTNVEAIRQIVAQCRVAAVPVFVKQLGRRPFQPREADGCFVPDYEFYLKDGKGGDPSEWPEDLRVREVPA